MEEIGFELSQLAQKAYLLIIVPYKLPSYILPLHISPYL